MALKGYYGVFHIKKYYKGGIKMLYEYNGKFFCIKAVSDLFTYFIDITNDNEIRLFNCDFGKLNRIKI